LVDGSLLILAFAAMSGGQNRCPWEKSGRGVSQNAFVAFFMFAALSFG
jgi:hypothetical protein